MKVVCLYDDWHCAYGDVDCAVHEGMVLTVSEERYVGGAKFYQFEETPEKNLYLCTGFRPQTVH